MFGIGMTEVIVILIIALIVIGPDKLPEIAKILGKGVYEFKKATEEFRNTVHSDMREKPEENKLLMPAPEDKPADNEHHEI